VVDVEGAEGAEGLRTKEMISRTMMDFMEGWACRS
jgi:hypothetical protein